MSKVEREGGVRFTTPVKASCNYFVLEASRVNIMSMFLCVSLLFWTVFLSICKSIFQF